MGWLLKKVGSVFGKCFFLYVWCLLTQKGDRSQSCFKMKKRTKRYKKKGNCLINLTHLNSGHFGMGDFPFQSLPKVSI